MEFGLTRGRDTTRRRGEYAIALFDIGTANRDTLPHTLIEEPCLDFYWQPIIGATYHYADRVWEITKIDIPVEKKGSHKTRFVPVVTLKLLGAAIDD